MDNVHHVFKKKSLIFRKKRFTIFPQSCLSFRWRCVLGEKRQGHDFFEYIFRHNFLYCVHLLPWLPRLRLNVNWANWNPALSSSIRYQKWNLELLEPIRKPDTLLPRKPCFRPTDKENVTAEDRTVISWLERRHEAVSHRVAVVVNWSEELGGAEKNPPLNLL